MFKGPAPLATTHVFKVEEAVGTPVTAVVEPDADGDGYGDETQDRCPTGAAYQGDCPAVTLRSTAKVRKRSILLRVNSTAKASVEVYGQVGWGIKPKPSADAGRSKRKTRIIVALSGGTEDVAPGKATRFTIPLPRPVLRRLGRLTPRESLKAKLTARSTDLAGRVKNTRLTVKLRAREST